MKLSRESFKLTVPIENYNSNTNDNGEVIVQVSTYHDRHGVVHEDDVELVAHFHHRLYCLLSILSYGGLNACVRVCVCVLMHVCVRAIVRVFVVKCQVWLCTVHLCVYNEAASQVLPASSWDSRIGQGRGVK